MNDGRRWVCLGAAILPESEAVVPVRHRGFLHGETLFETLRAESGRPIWLCEHLERLESSARELEFPLPARPPVEELLVALLRRNRLRDARLRLTVTREEDPGWILTADPLELPVDAAAYREGVSVTTWSPPWAPWGGSGAVAKSGAWMAPAAAQRKARAGGDWEAIRLDPQRRVCEGAASNLFWLRKGTLETPALSLGILAGIIREKVIALAPALGLQVRELAEPLVAHLEEADEIVLTNSLWEVLPVVRWRGRPVGDGRVGPWAPQLRQALRTLAGGALRPGSRP